jgi:hypothetical protein
MLQRLILVLLCTALLLPLSQAQRHGGGMGGFHFAPGFARGFGFNGGFHHEGYGAGFAYLGDPFLYADYPAAPPGAQPPSPQVIVLQPAGDSEKAPAKEINPLLIELQGNQYVRFEGEVGQRRADAAAGVRSAPPIESSARTASSASKTTELRPAILVYRDGHREEVSDYAIAGGVLYARGSFWQDGYWTKNIQLAALDIPATMKANQEGGVKFVLPSLPNEVVTRP